LEVIGSPPDFAEVPTPEEVKEFVAARSPKSLTGYDRRNTHDEDFGCIHSNP
jgi:hypothetical protein